MTELVARLHSNGAGVRMRGMFERVTWPLRKLLWMFEEQVLWRIGDAIHKTPRRSRVEARAAAELPAATFEFPDAPSELAPPVEAPSAASEPAATLPEFPIAPSELVPAQVESPAAPGESPVQRTERATRRLLSPLKGRLGSPVRDVSIVLATIAVAIGVGVGIATFVGPSGETQGGAGQSASAAAAPAGSSAGAETASGPTTLQGVAPDFDPSSKSQPATSNATATTNTDTQVSPLADTNSKPSSIPPGVAENIAAMGTARDFAGAFVLYEVGESNPTVRKTFSRTATPALARALRDRPPRLPGSVQVPTAKVQNVVLGTERGRDVDASVSLLRLGDLSELRLTLTKRNGTWAVSEVRG